MTESPTFTSRPGNRTHLGATVTDGGVNFAVASTVAESVAVCLFDSDGNETRFELEDYDAGTWHGLVPGVGPGQAYGYRVNGPFDPGNGLRCNPGKLLLDPYARAIVGGVTYGPALLGHDPDDPAKPGQADSAPFVPRSVVIDSGGYDWEGDTQLHHRSVDSVIYEVHVKGFTARHPDIPPEIRGTYAGLGHEAAVSYLRDLGVTAVELLPVHEYVTEGFLIERGLTNYWGYNTIGFFAPHQGYSAAVRAGQGPDGQVNEFRNMVKALHRAGIEVILDVVYNHTAEGNENGPTLSFRGLDNGMYYRLVADDASRYYDTTGTGNSLNAGNPYTLRLIMDSLRYWMSEMHVDGFRFDLAATLGREEDNHFDQLSAFFEVVAQDPVTSQAKLIAEPWDVGQSDSYDLGQFPAEWREWNGRYRDSMRDFWRSRDVGVAEFATRFSGSPDLYGSARRRPTASVNLLTVHDGFTLRDLVSYDEKHNLANGENNTDGNTANNSWNCGVEGPTSDAAVNELRLRQQKNFAAILLVSHGVPMLLAGDELGRTQRGNNNAYCQDNDISWVDWRMAESDAGLLRFFQQMIAFRRRTKLLRRDSFELNGEGRFHITWHGTKRMKPDWSDCSRSIAMQLTQIHDEHTRDDLFFIANAYEGDLDFELPQIGEREWFRVVDTAQPSPSDVAEDGQEFPLLSQESYAVQARSVAVFVAK